MHITTEQAEVAARAAYEQYLKLHAAPLPKWDALHKLEQDEWRSIVVAAFAVVEVPTRVETMNVIGPGAVGIELK